MALAQNDRKAFESAGLYEKWSRLQIAFQAIWEDVYADDADAKLKQLDLPLIDAPNAGIGWLNDQKAMLKWQLHTEREYQLQSPV